MNVLVTGGAGFIGANFLRLSVPRHPEHRFVNVDALTYAANPKSLAPVEGAANYAFERVDIADAAAVEACFDRHAPELVVHFAAETHVDRSILGPAPFVRTNVEGTLNLLEACRRRWTRGEGLFHHVSTDEVYGSLGPTGRFTEASRYAPSSPYSASKAASDHLVRAWHRTYGLPVKITSSGNNYGPLQFPEKLIPLMLLNLVEGRPLPIYGDGGHVRDWLYVVDHCEAIWAVIARGAVGETYNVGAHVERTNLEVVEALIDLVAEATGADAEGLRARVSFVPDRPGHDRRYALDASRLARDCAWTPRHTFEVGLRETVRWYLDNEAWVRDVQSGAYRDWIRENYGAR